MRLITPDHIVASSCFSEQMANVSSLKRPVQPFIKSKHAKNVYDATKTRVSRRFGPETILYDTKFDEYTSWAYSHNYSATKETQPEKLALLQQAKFWFFYKIFRTASFLTHLTWTCLASLLTVFTSDEIHADGVGTPEPVRNWIMTSNSVSVLPVIRKITTANATS